MNEKVVNCFGCKKQVVVDEEGVPENATTWQTNEKCNSEYYEPYENDYNDEGEDEHLEIVICDECLEKNQELISTVSTETTTETTETGRDMFSC